MQRSGWKRFICKGEVWFAHRQRLAGSSSAAGFLPVRSPGSVIEFRHGPEYRLLNRRDVLTNPDLGRMIDAELCRMLAAATPVAPGNAV